MNQLLKILLASMKNFPNDKDWSESSIIISVSTFLSVIGGFSPVSTPHWMYDKSALISGPQAGFRKVFLRQNHRVRKSEEGYWIFAC